MKCAISGLSVKVLAKAIHALARIGDELYVEPLVDSLSLRSVNSSKSAYSSFTFSSPFFISYKSNSEDQNGDIKCKISIKSCIPIFKYPSSLDKHVETCIIRLDANGTRLIIEFRCRHHVIRTHFLPIIECETLQAVYPNDSVPNRLVIQPKVLGEAIQNFHSNLDEITLSVSPQRAQLSSYNDDSTDPAQVLHTELCLASEEFDHYIVGSEAAVTFCLKEVRALLSFAEAVSLPIIINFEDAGRPVVFVITNEHAFEAHFVLATLSVEDSSQTSISQGCQVSKSQKSKLNKSAASDNHKTAPGKDINNELLKTRDNTSDNSSNVGDFQGENEDNIPGTPPPPPSKKARYIFKKCFQSTFDPASLSGYDEFLAAASDED